MRGARQLQRLFGFGDRIIPADAGSTGRCNGRPPNRWDHPRGCGEHRSGAAAASLVGGSSPRMRGAPVAAAVQSAAGGIIPADAGSTLTHIRQDALEEDHPRGCGEHRFSRPVARWRRGSSPRMRGALDSAEIALDHRRIIPADAGSTSAFGSAFGPYWDHPRGCGEHLPFGRLLVSRNGSSPRMRGALDRMRRSAFRTGIIPADAGSTASRRRSSTCREDHPRGCGEHSLHLKIQRPPSGSSPRMRGARNGEGIDKVTQGIIPADAGSTPWKAGMRMLLADHPRGCGEHWL